jgi:hypothetical protein
MPIDGGSQRSYALGRECKLTIDGREIKGATDVTIGVAVTSVDGSAYNSFRGTQIPVQWQVRISFSCPEIEDAKYIKLRRWSEKQAAGGSVFRCPRVLAVSTEGGLFDNGDEGGPAEGNFIIQDIESEEPLNGVVVSRFNLVRWDGGTRTV